jgi:TPR repeat protein
MPSKSFKTLFNKALKGNYEALGKFYKLTKTPNAFTPEEIEHALKIIEKLLTQKDSPKRTHAFFLRALWHYYGIGGNKDNQIAFKLYKEAIDLNNPFAMNELGYLYLKDKHYKDALELFERAVGLNNIPAMNNLAYMYKTGEGVKLNYDEAIKLYQKAIDLKDPEAMHKRALMHCKGLGGEVNYEEAIRLFEDAIKLGHALSMKHRADLHKNALGGEKNYRKAFVLYKEYEKRGEKVNFDLSELQDEIIKDLKTNNPELNKLYQQIGSMFAYGIEIGDDKGDMLKAHVRALTSKLDLFLIQSCEEAPSKEKEDQFKEEFISLLRSKDKEMEQHREVWKPIVVNILIALSGVGFLALIAKVSGHAISCHLHEKHFSLNNACFFAKTKSQKQIKTIERTMQHQLKEDIRLNLS